MTLNARHLYLMFYFLVFYLPFLPSRHCSLMLYGWTRREPSILLIPLCDVPSCWTFYISLHSLSSIYTSHEVSHRWWYGTLIFLSIFNKLFDLSWNSTTLAVTFVTANLSSTFTYRMTFTLKSFRVCSGRDNLKHDIATDNCGRNW